MSRIRLTKAWPLQKRRKARAKVDVIFSRMNPGRFGVNLGHGGSDEILQLLYEKEFGLPREYSVRRLPRKHCVWRVVRLRSV